MTEVERLQAYADNHELILCATKGNQREPENVVWLREPPAGEWTPGIISAQSLDSVEIAAYRMIKTLERLGVEVP